MGKTISKSNCCAVDQASSNLTLSGELDKHSISMDDEPLITNSSLDESRDLPSLSINLNFTCNYIQQSNESQEWPVCISVESRDLPLEERPGVDIVCLIETSQYSKNKEKSIKSALEFLLNRLTGQDRLSLVSFNDTCKRLTPLVSMTFTGKLRINLVIQSLQFFGSCDAEEGLRVALSVLANRRNFNTYSHMIVFSTGLDNHPESAQERIDELLSDFHMRTSAVFTGHVFAVGPPQQVLNFIAEETNGTCYLELDEGDWVRNFAYACGIIESKVAEEICAEIFLNHETIPIGISKVYSENGQTLFRMPDALAGSKMDTLFILKVLPSDFSERLNDEILKVKVSYKIKGNSYSEEKSLNLPIFPQKKVLREIEIDEEVLQGFYRVKVADVLHEASLIIMNDKNQAEVLIRNAIQELDDSCISNLGIIQTLRKDLMICLHLPQTLSVCSVIFRNLARNHWSKRAAGVEQYQNTITDINKNRMKALFG